MVELAIGGSPLHKPELRKRFRRVFDDHYDDLLRYCLRRLSRADANDAVAEVFTVAWRKVDEIPEGDEARLWLYGIARNVVRNSKRSAYRAGRLRLRIRALAPQPVPEVESVIIRGEEARLIVDAMARLSPSDQEVLRLRAYEGLDSAQIASVLACSEVAARKRVSRAVSRLAKAAGFEKSPNVNESRAIQMEGGDL